jgi:diaminohydroxyphosphoribosylaminopyrimidine deaminase/5-amino-6-(5-phosphoribosylamino)uracil reductase
MDGKIGGSEGQRILISNHITNRLVHKWRSEEAGILIGPNTAMKDDPSLTTRLWKGKNPVRMVVDLDLKLPPDLKIFDGSVKTIVFNHIKDAETNQIRYYRLIKNESLIMQLQNALYKMNIQSLIVEGGAQLLQSFINENSWDEARVITNQDLLIGKGTDAPLLKQARLSEKKRLLTDIIHIYKPVL